MYLPYYMNTVVANVHRILTVYRNHLPGHYRTRVDQTVIICQSVQSAQHYSSSVEAKISYTRWHCCPC